MLLFSSQFDFIVVNCIVSVLITNVQERGPFDPGHNDSLLGRLI